MNYPEGAEFLFIAFKLGTFLPRLPIANLVDTGIMLPAATSQSFWLDCAAWQYPDYENKEQPHENSDFERRHDHRVRQDGSGTGDYPGGWRIQRSNNRRATR